jgi:hypothetical protein
MDSAPIDIGGLAPAIVQLLASGSRAARGALALLSLFIGFTLDVAVYWSSRHAPSDSSIGRKRSMK